MITLNLERREARWLAEVIETALAVADDFRWQSTAGAHTMALNRLGALSEKLHTKVEADRLLGAVQIREERGETAEDFEDWEDELTEA